MAFFGHLLIFQDGRVNALYSTPSLYTDAKNAANQSWPLKTDDYFPWVSVSPLPLLLTKQDLLT